MPTLTAKLQSELRGIELGAVFARTFYAASPYVIAIVVRELQRINRKMHRHAERLCNESPYADKHTDPETGDDKLTSKHIGEIKAALLRLVTTAPHGFDIILNGDPRGFCMFTLGVSDYRRRATETVGDNVERTGFDIY